MDQEAEIARKLGIKPDSRVVVVGSTEAVPPDGSGERPDIVVAYFGEASDLRAKAERLGNLIYPNGMLWIAWPRKAAGHQSDITENLIREVVLPLGLVDTKVAALGEDWSGLRVVWRRERRAG